MSKESFCELPQEIALVHEWFSRRSFGGAEQVVKRIDECLRGMGIFPDLACLVDGESTKKGSWLKGRSVQTSPIQNFPWGDSHVQQYLPLLPYAIEQLNFEPYKLVISSNHLVAKGIITSPEQLHVSYVHTPVRYAWDQMQTYLNRSSLVKIGLGPLIRWQLHHLRQWDQLTSQRVDCLIANSRFTARRINKYWGREAKVIPPPVKTEQFFCNKPRDERYITVSRLVPNKRVDLLVKAFNQLKLPLVVVGEGPEKKYLKKIANKNVQIVGYQTQREISNLMSSCRAFVYAGVEDFGIAPVEAMASGAPVIAFARGGVLDTVRCMSKGTASSTGVLFEYQSIPSIIEAVNWFEQKRLWKKFSPEEISRWANNFSSEKFDFRFTKALTEAWRIHKNTCDVASSDPFGAVQRL